MAAAKAKSSILLAKNILSETCKTSDQLLLEKGRAVYTCARSVYSTKVFRLSQHVDRLFTGLSALFPEEQKKYNISKDVIRNNVVTNVTKARDYLRQVNSTKLDDNFDIKFSVIIEKPTEDDHLPMSVLVSEMGRCHQPPIICDVYQVIRHNAVVKDSNWVKERDSYYKKSGPSIEDIVLCENNKLFEGGQSNFFAVKNGVVYTKGDGVLQGTVRTMVLNICEKLNIPLCQEAPLLSEVMDWDGCFITSTSRFVMNVNTIRQDGKVLKTFTEVSPVIKKIQDAVEEELKIECEEMF